MTAESRKTELTTNELIEELKKRGMSSDDILNAIFAEKPIPAEKEDNLENKVSKILHEIGIPAHLKGYRYVRKAIIIVVEEPEKMESITKILYPTLAKFFETTPPKVERAIRHAIGVAWDRGDVDTLHKYFGYTIQVERGTPTNSEFIAMIADNILIERK